jgi:hypothetical protein
VVGSRVGAWGGQQRGVMTMMMITIKLDAATGMLTTVGFSDGGVVGCVVGASEGASVG